MLNLKGDLESRRTPKSFEGSRVRKENARDINTCQVTKLLESFDNESSAP